MYRSPIISDYFTAFYFVEVMICLLLGIVLLLAVRKGRRVDWPPINVWPRLSVFTGWLFVGLGTLTWVGLMYVMIRAWLMDVQTDYPKQPALVFLVLGGLLFIMLIGIARSAFHASSGSAREDIMKMLGK